MTDYNKPCAFLIDKITPEFDLAYSKDVSSRLARFNGGEKPLLITGETLADGVPYQSVKAIFSTWNMPILTASEIKRYFPSLEYVFYAAGTVKYFAEPFFECGVRVFCANSENAIPVAEYAAAQIILAGKGFFNAKISPLGHFFIAKKRALTHAGNYHSKVGILGAGHVGRSVIEILKRDTELDIYVYDPYVSEESCAKMGCRKASLEEVFSVCDVISNHMPDIDETRGIICERLLNTMKPSAGIINTGRGAQIIEKDLVRSLRQCKSRFAVLDVTSPEPIRPWNPLLRMSNAYVTPHIAGSMGTEIERLGAAMCDAYEAVVTGDTVFCEIRREQLTNMA